jgi:CHAT domain-containing protein
MLGLTGTCCEYEFFEVLITHWQEPSGSDRSRVHWCPVGELVFLPIHAAGVYSQGKPECCSDYVVSSYAPTLSALRRARMHLVPMDRQSLVLLATAASQSSASPGLSRLDNVRPEISHVAQIARASGCVDVLECGATSAAKLREVRDALPRANIVHLACHGVQDQEDPLDSGFFLGDGKLAVSDLMNLRLDRAFLAFLSACETAKGDKKQPDQVIHLAAAMLFCGFRSVVATMW